MQALRVTSLSPDLSGTGLADLPIPVRAEDQVLIQVRATSLNYPDLLMTRGEYQLKPGLPFIPGMEVSGIVVEAAADSAFARGDAVVGACRLGGMAEFVAVDAAALRLLPAGLDHPTAASFGAAYHTAWVALVEQGGLKPGQWVLVHGASGGVGLAAVDLAKALGARVIAASTSPEKLEVIAEAYHPDATILASGRFRDAVAEITGGALADLVFDPVGGDIFDESTRCVAFGGKLLVIGFASGRIPQVSINIPLIKGFAVVGVRAGEFARRFPQRGLAARDALYRLLEDGKLSPRVDRVLALSRWHEAFEAMAARQIIGKIVLVPGQ